MVERENLSELSTLALRNRREGLTQLLPPLGEILRGSLDRALSDLRQAGLQVRPGGAAWTGVVFERQLGPSAPHR